MSQLNKMWNSYVQAFKMGPTFQWRLFHERTCRCNWCADYWTRMKAGPDPKMTLKSPFTKREILEFGRAELAKLEGDPDFMYWIPTECSKNGDTLDLGWMPRTGVTYYRVLFEKESKGLGSLKDKVLISCLLDTGRRHRPPELERNLA